jgi:hypothetical protein
VFPGPCSCGDTRCGASNSEREAVPHGAHTPRRFSLPAVPPPLTAHHQGGRVHAGGFPLRQGLATGIDGSADRSFTATLPFPAADGSVLPWASILPSVAATHLTRMAPWRNSSLLEAARLSRGSRQRTAPKCFSAR